MESMLDYIRKYPQMILDAIEITKNSKLPRYDFDKIVVCGMGGSAVGGDLLKDLMRTNANFKWPIEISRRYRPPAYINDRTLVFCISYSGNTEETLSQFIEARKLGCKIISITSDGYLKKWSETLGIPIVSLPTGFKPRAAMPYLFVPMLVYLSKYTTNPELPDLKEAVEVLESVACTVEKEEEIKKIADIIKGHVIKVYGPADFESVIRRAKNQFNENSKLPATWSVFPELNHNEIVGYEDNDLNSGTYVLILRDSNESESMKTRIEATKKIIQSKVKGIVEIHSDGKSKLARIISLLYYIDLLSYYLAVAEGKIPEKTDFIDKLKSILAEKVGLVKKLETELI